MFGAPQELPVYEISFEHQNEIKEIVAEAIVEAQDGGVLARTTEGELFLIQPETMKRKEPLSSPFKPMTQDEICRKLEKEFANFKTLKTKNYILCYETSDAYAQWVGALCEKVYKGFQGFWKTKDFKLSEPRFPLVIVVFRTKETYLKYSEQKLGRDAESLLGYFDPFTNRVTTFDLTEVDGMIPKDRRINKSDLINEVLSRPQAERNVSTIRHEAIHQIAYNTGLQTRLADNPQWVSEGLAIFFESHDMSSKSGKGVGLINEHNLAIFRNYMPKRPPDSLLQLMTDDMRFRDGKTISISYGESWAFNYFLLKKHAKEYTAYLKFLSAKKPQEDSDPKQRIEEFQRFFKSDIRELDRNFLQFMAGLN